MPSTNPAAFVAIACGGTGGHLFPGVAVGEELTKAGCEVALLISQKDVDQQSVRNLSTMSVVTLPAVGLERGRRWKFFSAFWKSFRQSKEIFRQRRPAAVLAMGGFTAAPPILAARFSRARTFLHESNAVPGRANRWLAPWVNQIFVGLDAARCQMRNRNIICSGTPVRGVIGTRSVVDCRISLGLEPDRPVLLVTGGSQGASAINELVARSLPLLAKSLPALQYIHLTGSADLEKIRTAYSAQNSRAWVHSFSHEMDVMLGAATVAVSRAGASSLAEFAASGLPAILVPYPAAVDNHQWHNARAAEAAGGAVLMEQKAATPEKLCEWIEVMIRESDDGGKYHRAMESWHKPYAARDIAKVIFDSCARRAERKHEIESALARSKSSMLAQMER